MSANSVYHISLLIPVDTRGCPLCFIQDNLRRVPKKCEEQRNQTHSALRARCRPAVAPAPVAARSLDRPRDAALTPRPRTRPGRAHRGPPEKKGRGEEGKPCNDRFREA